jgi:peptide-methionine (R)-S-oxide reductase
MNRRTFLSRAMGAVAGAAALPAFSAPPPVTRVVRTDAEWRAQLTPEQYRVLREEGTEWAGSSPLNHEKRKGTYVCAACELALFTSGTKYDSGTGWPSFYDSIPGRIGTKVDYRIGVPRTEYHCARCDGHQGHVFEDGPKPTGLRYCNNGVALKFQPA